MALTSRITAQIDATESGTLDLGTKVAKIQAGIALALANGTADDQADMIWSDTRTIAASGTDDLDLAGSLVGAFGNTLTFAKIKAIFVIADDGNTNNVVIGAAAATQFVGPFGANTHTVAVRPGGFTAFAAPNAGWTVGAGATDLLRIANSSSGTSVTYKIIIIGTSA